MGAELLHPLALHGVALFESHPTLRDGRGDAVRGHLETHDLREQFWAPLLPRHRAVSFQGSDFRFQGRQQRPDAVLVHGIFRDDACRFGERIQDVRQEHYAPREGGDEERWEREKTALLERREAIAKKDVRTAAFFGSCSENHQFQPGIAVCAVQLDHGVAPDAGVQVRHPGFPLRGFLR